MPLFRPGRALECVDQIQWAFKVHAIVAKSHCPHYQGQTELKSLKGKPFVLILKIYYYLNT